MNKKVYITPEMEVMNIDTIEMIAASVQYGTTDDPVDAGGAWSNGRRGTWGDLWYDGE